MYIVVLMFQIVIYLIYPNAILLFLKVTSSAIQASHYVSPVIELFTIKRVCSEMDLHLW